jgi:hypothetical protein
MAGVKPPPPWKEIARRRREIEAARREKLKEAMRNYDQDVFNPAMAQLREDCAAQGHGSANHESNGVGVYWTQCIRCGGQVKQWNDWQGDDAAKAE